MVNNKQLADLLNKVKEAYAEFNQAVEKFNMAVAKAKAEIQKARDAKKLAAVRKIIK